MSIPINQVGHGDIVRANPTLPQLLLADRERNADPDYSVQKRPGVAQAGLLYRTLIRGSIIKRVIPTRLQNVETAELLFVGENHIELQEIDPIASDAKTDLRLRHLVTMNVAEDCHIRSAALIGYYLKTVRAQNGQVPQSRLSPSSPAIKLEDSKYRLQIIALALTSATLRLLCYDQSSELGKAKLKTLDIPLPDPGSSFATEPGKSMAVDRFSRAIAVSAAFDGVMVYSLRSGDEIKERIEQNPEHWNPLKKEKLLNFNGCIIGVEFLNPGPDAPDWVIMIVVTASKGRNGLWCVRWDYEDGPENYQVVLQDCPLRKFPGERNL